MDLKLGLMTGIDLPIEGCQLIVHQPTIKDISYLGEERFFTGVQTICLYKSMFTSEDKGVLDDVTNFQIFMTIVKDKEMNDKKIAVEQLLEILIQDKNVEEKQELLRSLQKLYVELIHNEKYNPHTSLEKQIMANITDDILPCLKTLINSLHHNITLSICSPIH